MKIFFIVYFAVIQLICFVPIMWILTPQKWELPFLILLILGVLAISISSQLGRGTMDKSLLVKAMTLDEIEAEHRQNGLPFRYQFAEWTRFLASLQAGDEIWYWMTPPNTWRMMAGRGGYVIVRDGKPTRHTITSIMN